MLRLGIVDTDSSHAVEFTKRVNHFGDLPDTWIEGARVVGAVPLPSRIRDEAGVKQYADLLRDMDVELLDSIDTLADRVDGLLLLSDDGGMHLDRVKRVVDKGLPVFCDKPLEASVATARELVGLAKQHDCPLFSASSLRYAVEIQAFQADVAPDAVISAVTHSPFSVGPTVPGLIYYAIHGVEPLFAIMGPGCREVRCVQSETGPAAVGTWDDGRLGIVRATATCHGYGFTAWCKDNQIVQAKVDSSKIYGELLKRVIAFFETRQSPVDPDETVEIISFMESANRSAELGGQAVALA